MSKPLIAVTMGDPAGVGPELVAKVIESEDVRAVCRPVVFGDPDVMQKAVELTKSRLEIKEIQSPAEASNEPSIMNIIPSGLLGEAELIPGKLGAAYGKSAAETCSDTVDAAKDGKISAIVSTPFNKEAFHMSGETSMDDMVYFKECFGGDGDVYMVGEVAGLWVTMVAYHVSFRSIADLITKEAVEKKILALSDVMESAGVNPVRIGVAGLNVHSGEGGIFGMEEIEQIEPAIKASVETGVDVVGPVPPDSLFVKALQGQYSGLVCMYHDQANIGRKILGMNEPGVTLYMGMPVPVLTVPHGTAYDIAWKGDANAAMLKRAVLTAAAMVSGKR